MSLSLKVYRPKIPWFSFIIELFLSDHFSVYFLNFVESVWILLVVCFWTNHQHMLTSPVLYTETKIVMLYKFCVG